MATLPPGVRTALAALCALLVILSGCPLAPGNDPEQDSGGSLLLGLDLSRAQVLGYDVSRVLVTLTHEASDTEVEAQLTVDTENDRATGLIRNLRTGPWDVLVQLYEGEDLAGQGTGAVLIEAGVTKQVTIRITLAAGSVDVTVEWGDEDGPAISFSEFEGNFGEIEVGTSSEPRELSIYNTGTGDLVISSVSLPDTTNFVLDLNGGSRPIGGAGAVIPPGGKGTLTITCVPQTEGALTANLQITSNIVVSPTITLPWVAVGRPPLIALPDLVPAGFAAPASAYAGDSIGEGVSVSVKSTIGTADTTDGAITVAFYLSSDWLWSAGDVPLANGRAEVTTPIGGVDPVPVPVPPTMTVPVGTPVGSYYLLAVVDADGEVFEGHETNNTASLVLVVATSLDVSGTLYVGGVGEIGNYIDVTFTSTDSVTLVDVSFDWSGHNVWVDCDQVSSVPPENQGVASYSFHFGDPPSSTPPASNYQVFGFYATGFNSGDSMRITMDMDLSQGSGEPLYEDYYGGRATVRFSDGTTFRTLFNLPGDTAFAAMARFGLVD
jgi:hypothetical protein